MRGATVVASVAFLSLAAAIVAGATSGVPLREGLSALVGTAWGRATVVDLYAGIALFSLWVIHRERSPLPAALWIVGTCILGNLVPCAYVVLAARRARGDRARFFHGPTPRSTAP